MTCRWHRWVRHRDSCNAKRFAAGTLTFVLFGCAGASDPPTSFEGALDVDYEELAGGEALDPLTEGDLPGGEDAEPADADAASEAPGERPPPAGPPDWSSNDVAELPWVARGAPLLRRARREQLSARPKQVTDSDDPECGFSAPRGAMAVAPRPVDMLEAAAELRSARRGRVDRCPADDG